MSAMRPPLRDSILFFYYQDLAAAARWYEERLGARRLWDGGWVVIFEVGAHSRIGLVDSARGFLKPAPGERRCALFSVEVDDVHAWYAYMSSFQETCFLSPVAVATEGLTETFVVQDPGGYPVEFFRWRNLQTVE
jgi:extradiol dioxygenase family protein